MFVSTQLYTHRSQKRIHFLLIQGVCTTLLLIRLSGKNADEALERIKNDVANGNPVNELELIFVPLMES
ncbi:hypothetical protein ACKUB1_07655 [Methanospirillum stamsii]|uniref:hypothetical protein n=1 Tax=Methanospirillum stamsii TaxID=1277351 RepID=UPI0011B22490